MVGVTYTIESFRMLFIVIFDINSISGSSSSSRRSLAIYTIKLQPITIKMRCGIISVSHILDILKQKVRWIATTNYPQSSFLQSLNSSTSPLSWWWVESILGTFSNSWRLTIPTKACSPELLLNLCLHFLPTIHKKPTFAKVSSVLAPSLRCPPDLNNPSC